MFRDRLIEEGWDRGIGVPPDAHDLRDGRTRVIQGRDGSVDVIDRAAEPQRLEVGQAGDTAS